ncbi:MAG: cytochrome c oxidase subunit 3 [Flammeovirgaceae bacterium]
MNIHPTDTQLITKTSTGIHPKKFGMWLFMVSVVMLFGSLTSAYIVRRAEGNWHTFELPVVFYYSTVVILLSSATMHWSYLSAKKDELGKLKAGILITSILGFVFMTMQWFGWKALTDMEVFFAFDNPSGSFLYVISGLHGLHILSGVVYLFIILFASFRYEVHSKSLVRLEMCASYWHFLDLLWVYLFVFLWLYR